MTVYVTINIVLLVSFVLVVASSLSHYKRNKTEKIYKPNEVFYMQRHPDSGGSEVEELN
jgi:hypothetical protein